MYLHFIKVNILVIILFVLSFFLISIPVDIDNFNYGSYLFLPHAIRVIAAVVFGKIAFFGLFISHLLVAEFLTSRALDINLLLSLIGSSSCFIAVFILNLFKMSKKNFNKIKFEQLLFLILFSSIVNTIGTFLVFDNIFIFSSIEFIFSYLVGDFFGGVLGFYLFIKIYSAIKKNDKKFI